MLRRANIGERSATAAAGVVLLGLSAAGVMLVVYFFSQLFMPARLTSLSLPLVALLAALASAFNPCVLPILPVFLARTARGGDGRRPRRAALSLMMSLGAMSVLVALGIVVALLGMEVQLLVAPHFGRVQAAGGLVLLVLAAAHGFAIGGT